MCNQQQVLALPPVERSYPEPCCANGYAERGGDK
jgi:hypothetical protein